jgi:hypothetical protein
MALDPPTSVSRVTGVLGLNYHIWLTDGDGASLSDWAIFEPFLPISAS